MAANWDPDNISTPVVGKHAEPKSRRRTAWGVAVLFAFMVGLVALFAWAWVPSDAPLTTGAVPSTAVPNAAVPPAVPPAAPATQP